MARETFRLSENFLNKYKNEKASFGFDGFGEIVYMRSYSRVKSNNINEQWYETVARVVNGTYNMQKRHIDEYGLRWIPQKAQRSAQEMYKRIFSMKFLPPGRGLFAMGSAITEERRLFASLNNCAFCSTENLREDPTKPFTFLMDASMCGVGVGFDTKGEDIVLIKGVNNRTSEIYIIPDTREGWVESLRLLLESYFYGLRSVEFDYSEIRDAGEPIKGFGGISAGPRPLKELHEVLIELLDEMTGEFLSATTIVDIMNLIGICVVSGGVRRTAEIVFGDYESDEYLDLKNYSVNPHRAEYGWASNNSIFADLGMDYSSICDRTRINGESGFAWLENMLGYSRIMDGPDYKDKRSIGANPCMEQTLESYELCCLVETFPDKHDSFEDYQKTLKFAYLYAKTVTLGLTHWPETNQVMIRNRRIGCSMSGIAQFITHRGINELKDWTQKGYDTIQQYDEIYSDWLGIPLSKKTTSIKPSGTVSLLAGATPGMHFPESRFYIRRMELSINSPLIVPLKKANYVIVESKRDPENTVLVEAPIDVGEGIRTAKELSMWEQLSLAAFLQRYWADNQVSCTVTFDPETEGSQLQYALDYFQYQLKGISFYPRKGQLKDKIDSFTEMLKGIKLEELSKHNQARVKKVLEFAEKLDIRDEFAYEQPPYEEIDEETYINLSLKLKSINFKGIKGADPISTDKFCDNDSCEIELPVLN